MFYVENKWYIFFEVHCKNTYSIIVTHLVLLSGSIAIRKFLITVNGKSDDTNVKDRMPTDTSIFNNNKSILMV